MNNKPSGNKPKIITPPLMPTWAMFNFNPLSGNASHFIILLCLMSDDFTHQGESAATQWVNQTICPCTLLTDGVFYGMAELAELTEWRN
jgi:hypothetical protein